MSTEEPSAIDEKKAEEEGTTTEKTDWGGFFKNLGNGLIIQIFIGVVCIGSIGLFLAKAANANVFPTDIDMQPYKDIERKVKLDAIYMNPVKILPYFGLGFWEEPEKFWIQEANFVNPMADLNFMDKFFNTWLCSLQSKIPPNSTPSFWSYELNVLKSMMCMSFVFISSIFFYMNYLPEWLTMLVFALFFSIILIVIYIGNFFYGIYSHVIKLLDLFSETLNSKEINQTLYDYPRICMYFTLYFIATIFSMMISPALITAYTLFKSLSVNYITRNKSQKPGEPVQKMNLISFIKNVLYYKKTFIIILAMLKLMSSTNTYLGSTYMPGVIIAILVVIFYMKILVPDDASDYLYPVVNTNFPTVEPSIVEKGGEVKTCAEPVNNVIDTSSINSDVSKITGQPVNVLQEITGGITGGRKSFKNMEGGRSKKIPKSKLYNIKLV
jgi:hypothetical protein